MNETDLMVIESAKLLRKRQEKLKELISAPEIAADNILFRRYSNEFAELSEKVELYNRFEAAAISREKYEKELHETQETELKELIIKEIQIQDALICDITSKLKSALLKEQENEPSTAVLELKAAEGGDLAMLFCADILALYTNYAKRKGYSVKKVFYYNSADYIKYAVIKIEGDSAYTNLKFENGAHRIMSNGKTGTVTIIVLREEDSEIKVDENDIKIELFHSGGAGGQNVNKVESAVRAIHIPTAIAAVCQDERSQLRNKQRAIKTLKTRVYEYYLKKREEERKAAKTAIATLSRIRCYDYNKGKVFDKGSGTTEDLKFVKMGRIDNFINALILREKGLKNSNNRK